MNLVKIWTLNAYQNSVFLIFFNCYCNYVSWALYTIVMVSNPTNKTIMTIIEKSKKKLKISYAYVIL